MLFFFITIPCTLLFVAILFLCIKSITTGIHQLNTGMREDNEIFKKRGRTALFASVIILILAGYIYWEYFWDQVSGFFESSFSKL